MAHLVYSVLPFPRRSIVSIEPQITVKECIALMTTKDIGALVVFDANKKLLGMVTERDIIRSCLHQGLDHQTATAKDIAYVDVSVININDPVEKAMEIMTLTKRRHVLVDEDGELIAILSIGDLLFHLLEDKSRVIEHLENYIHS